MSLWLYVVIGLLVVIAILVLMKADSKPMRTIKRKTDMISNLTYICLHCGNSFQGPKCPTCGSNNKRPDFFDK
ncbi:MAG: hypothetical protein QXU32_12475 [Nitrososphaerales archaeon]